MATGNSKNRRFESEIDKAQKEANRKLFNEFKATCGTIAIKFSEEDVAIMINAKHVKPQMAYEALSIVAEKFGLEVYPSDRLYAHFFAEALDEVRQDLLKILLGEDKEKGKNGDSTMPC